jgi:hypothetical protein
VTGHTIIVYKVYKTNSNIFTFSLKRVNLIVCVFDRDSNFFQMRNLIKIFSLIFFTSSVVLNSCIPDEGFPSLSTESVTKITSNSCTCGGTIYTEGRSPITGRGICWSTQSYPTISDNRTSDGTGTGTFVSNISGLKASTTYYIRAYATNDYATAYGNEVSFTSSGF